MSGNAGKLDDQWTFVAPQDRWVFVALLRDWQSTKTILAYIGSIYGDDVLLPDESVNVQLIDLLQQLCEAIAKYNASCRTVRDMIRKHYESVGKEQRS